jgi:single-strand DNA-binding protein
LLCLPPDPPLIITGNLTDDPELKHTPNGNLVANFRLAVTARIKDGDSWRGGDTSFFRINVWRQLAEHVTDSLSKGDRATRRLAGEPGYLRHARTLERLSVELAEVLAELIAADQRQHGEAS